VISKINEVAHEQLDMELDDFEKKNIFMARDATLSQYAKDYAAAREFSLAKPFLLEISNDIVKKRIVKECLTEVKTKEELAVFTPDTMTLAFDSELKEMFITKEVLLGDDSTAISTMAKSFASGINAVSLSIQKDFLKECVLATYLKDTATGSALASEVLTILKERELQSELVKEIAEIQVGHNDPAGWGILFEHASSVTSPVTQLGEFAHLAVLSAKAMKKETSSFK
jgi:hypothetical protein